MRRLVFGLNCHELFSISLDQLTDLGTDFFTIQTKLGLVAQPVGYALVVTILHVPLLDEHDAAKVVFVADYAAQGLVDGTHGHFVEPFRVWTVFEGLQLSLDDDVRVCDVWKGYSHDND